MQNTKTEYELPYVLDIVECRYYANLQLMFFCWPINLNFDMRDFSCPYLKFKEKLKFIGFTVVLFLALSIAKQIILSCMNSFQSTVLIYYLLKKRKCHLVSNLGGKCHIHQFNKAF